MLTVMDDQSNPYASPLAPGAPVAVSYDGAKQPQHPWFSRALIFGLLLNAVLMGVMFALMLYAGWMASRQPNAEPPMSLVMMVGFTILGAAAYWPISSLAMLVYSITVDRGTRWWLLKSIVSGTMLLLWLSFCLLGLIFG